MNDWMRRLLVPAIMAPSIVFADVGHASWNSASYASSRHATSYQNARVVDVAPIYETVTVAVPREQCRVENVRYHQGRGASATAPVLGAIIGGAIGNAVGHKKRNKQVGAVVGAVLGGSIGYDISRNNRRQHDRVAYRQEEICEIVDDFRSEERLLGYDVTYRYGGATYQTRMADHPGRHVKVRVDVTPVG